MLFATVTYVALRWLRTVHYTVVTFSYGFFSVIECTICALITSTLQLPQSAEDWGFAIALALLAFLGQTFFTLALKYEDAGPISLIRTLEVPLTFMWQIIFLAELPDQCR
jgi:drug/metabolite transporter (DMT)-like permease